MNVGCKAKASSVVLLLPDGAKSSWIAPIGNSFCCRLYDGLNTDWMNPSYGCARFCTLRGASLEMLDFKITIMVELGLA